MWVEERTDVSLTAKGLQEEASQRQLSHFVTAKLAGKNPSSVLRLSRS